MGQRVQMKPLYLITKLIWVSKVKWVILSKSYSGSGGLKSSNGSDGSNKLNDLYKLIKDCKLGILKHQLPVKTSDNLCKAISSDILHRIYIFVLQPLCS